MYQVGDRVVHPMHGAGIIESIVQERLGGQLGSYYVFRMPSGGLTLKIPTGTAGPPQSGLCPPPSASGRCWAPFRG